MADEMKPTPRGFISGLFSDVLGRTLNMPSMPRTGIPALDLFYANRNSLFNAAGVGDVQKTAKRISYGQPLTTGSGMTLRPREEAINAAMTVIPLVGQGGRVANQAAMTAGRAGARYAERVVPQVMERGGLPAQLLGDISRGSVSPLDVYHGTPHTLPPTERNPLGEFDASKIGTGEGAQAYGYGIYTAEAPAVATRYKLAGVDTVNLMGRDGGSINISALPKPLQKAIEANVGAPDLLGNAERFLANKTNQSFYSEKYGAQSIDDSVKALKDLNAAGVSVKDSGNLYKVDLPDEKIATMLDWDKPLSQQPKTIQNWLKDSMNPYRSQLAAKDVGGNEPTGSLIYNRLAELMSEGKKSDVFTNAANYGAKNASQELADAGIAGIKYLDEGSRNLSNTWIVKHPRGGENVFSNKESAEAFLKRNPDSTLIEPKVTRNFVVFPNEEKSMTILERNGMPATPIESPTFTDPFGNTIGSSIR